MPPGDYLPADPCCDRFAYELTIVADGTRYEYVTVDLTADAPPALVEAIDAVEDFLAGIR